MARAAERRRFVITVEKYGRRHFAVYLNGGLLAVTLYKRAESRKTPKRSHVTSQRTLAGDRRGTTRAF
jgi:hypothetical protein